MRKAMLLLAVFALVGTLWAADPIIGTWKLNIAKSKFSPILQAMMKQPSPIEKTEVYREVNTDLIELSDGSPTSDRWTWPHQGGIINRQPPLSEEMSYVETLIELGHWYVTVLQNGKQVILIHKTFSKDGRTMRQTLTGTDPQGKPFEQILVFDRQ
jgi:hypothetical protein